MFFPLLLVPPKPLTISCSFFSPAKRNSKQTNKNVKQNMQKLISWHRPEEVETWQNPSMIRENGHWVPHLMKRLFALEICWERKKSIFFYGVLLGQLCFRADAVLQSTWPTEKELHNFWLFLLLWDLFVLCFVLVFLCYFFLFAIRNILKAQLSIFALSLLRRNWIGCKESSTRKIKRFMIYSNLILWYI